MTNEQIRAELRRSACEDDNPLNSSKTAEAEVERLFATP